MKYFVLCLMKVSLAVLLTLNTAWAADEDIISQVYLEFDPETGEFKTVRDPTYSGNSQHSAAQDLQVQQIQQKQEALASGPLQSDTSTTATVNPGQQTSTSTDAAGGGNTPVLLAGIVMLGLVGGVVLLVKRKNQHT
jgi:hypothetical protein